MVTKWYIGGMYILTNSVEEFNCYANMALYSKTQRKSHIIP